MVLTDTSVRQAKPTGKDYTLPDFGGLSLAVSAKGSKSWHFRYYWLDKQKRMSLGTYPEVSLREARVLKDEARALLASGVNPKSHRKQKRCEARSANENTFTTFYEKWLEFRSHELREGRQTTLTVMKRVFKKDVLPVLGKLSIYNIKRADLLEVIGRIERRKALSVAGRVRTWLNQLFRYALVMVPGLESNPAADLNIVAIPQPPVRHNPFLRMDELPQLLRMLRNYPGVLQTQLALRLLLLTGVRTGELRLATPEQFDLEQGLWIIPPEAVKQLQLDMRKKRVAPRDIPPYVVPLSIQAIEVVRHMLQRGVPGQRYLFPQVRSPRKPMSENTLNMALKRQGYKDRLTGHGIRATISTALNEIGYPKIWIDAQLSHADPDKVSSAYNHAEYVEQRRRMMQDWADRQDLFEQGDVERASRYLPGVAMRLPFAGAEPFSIMPSHLDLEEVIHEKVIDNVKAPEMASRITRLPAVLPRRPGFRDTATDAQRERLERLEIFNAPDNLSVVDFAEAIGKSRQSVNYDVRAGKLLALTLGNLGRRIPDWHLDPLKDRFIQAVLTHGWDMDGWQVYRLLARPCSALKGHAPIDALTPDNFHDLVMVICLAMKEDRGTTLRQSA